MTEKNKTVKSILMKICRLLLIFCLFFGLKLYSWGEIESSKEPLFYLNLPDDFLELLQQKFAILNETGNIRNKFLNREFSLPYRHFKAFLEQKYPFVQKEQQEDIDMQVCFSSEKEKHTFINDVSRLMDSYAWQKYFRDSEEKVAENAAIAYYLFVLQKEKIPFDALCVIHCYNALKMLVKTFEDDEGKFPLPIVKLKKILDMESIDKSVKYIFKRIEKSTKDDYTIVRWLKSCFSGCFN